MCYSSTSACTRSLVRLAAQVVTGALAEELMVELGRVLEGHIRYEERQLFPLIEQLLPDLEPLSPLGRGRR